MSSVAEHLAQPMQDADLRHSLAVRICHWINALVFAGLVITGFAIFLTYPELYWGHVGYRGYSSALRLADLGIVTGLEWTDESRRWGRNYHFSFAWIFAINGLSYVGCTLWRRSYRYKLLPTREELRPVQLAEDVRRHLRFQRFESKGGYNTLQKLSYICVIFVLCPLVITTGLGQSPAITAAFPEFLTIFGGRQSIRSLHMICALLLILFVIVHIAQVFIAGFTREMRGMITGRLDSGRKVDT